MADKPPWLRAHGEPWKPGVERLAFESGWIALMYVYRKLPVCE